MAISDMISQGRVTPCNMLALTLGLASGLLGSVTITPTGGGPAFAIAGGGTLTASAAAEAFTVSIGVSISQLLMLFAGAGGGDSGDDDCSSGGGNRQPPEGWTDWQKDPPTLPEYSAGQEHHIATDKHRQWAPRFQEIFERAGLRLDSEWKKFLLEDHPTGWINSDDQWVPGHRPAYHQEVFDRISGAVQPHNPFTNAYRHALQRELWLMRRDLITNGSTLRSHLGLPPNGGLLP